MEIPDLIRERLGDESLESAVNLGDEDLICFTPTRTFLYRSEGLLSDEVITVYDHDIERLAVSEGRRKTTFTLTYVDRKEQFKITQGRTEPVLERLLAGVLHVAEVIDDGEVVEGVFRFSELILIVTDNRLIKRVGRYVWESDYEEFAFSDVTALEFEEGSVATQVVLYVDGYPQRIKAPSDDARLVEYTLKEVLFDYYEVDSLSALNDALSDGNPDAVGPDSTDEDTSAGLALDDSISPLVDSDDEDQDTVDSPDNLRIEAATEVDSGSAAGTAAGTDSPDATTQSAEAEAASSTAGNVQDAEDTDAADPAQRAASSGVDPDEIEAMKSRLVTLTKVVKRQNELLKRQHETVNHLVDELEGQD